MAASLAAGRSLGETTLVLERAVARSATSTGTPNRSPAAGESELPGRDSFLKSAAQSRRLAANLQPTGRRHALHDAIGCVPGSPVETFRAVRLHRGHRCR